MRLLLTLALLTGPIAATGKELPQQNQCFCTQPTKSWPVPYVILKIEQAPAGCEKMKYSANGKIPEHNGILTCEALHKCLKIEYDYEKKRTALVARQEAALKGCRCRHSDSRCEIACEAARAKAREELAKLDARKSCFRKKTKAKAVDGELREGN